MEETARRATAVDVGAMVELAREATAELSVLRGGSVWSRHHALAEPLEAAVAEFVAAHEDARLAVVGTIDRTVVGYGLARLDRLHDGRALAVISDLYVMPGCRGVGVGEQMLDLLVAWARSQHAVGVDALALPGDRSTKNFFETFGLTARALVVHRSLESEVPEPT